MIKVVVSNCVCSIYIMASNKIGQQEVPSLQQVTIHVQIFPKVLAFTYPLLVRRNGTQTHQLRGSLDDASLHLLAVV